MVSMLRHPISVGRHALRHPGCFLVGFREAHTSTGITYDDDPWNPRSMAYDAGRDLRRLGRA